MTSLRALATLSNRRLAARLAIQQQHLALARRRQTVLGTIALWSALVVCLLSLAVLVVKV